MPYAQQADFSPPANPMATIWRYLDFPKFVWTLEHSALYFCRVELLPDPREGRLPSKQRRPGSDDLAKMDTAFETYARNYYVNCWHMNEGQSIAMWKYGCGGCGVALRSNFTRLCRALDATSRMVHIGTVHYGPDPFEQQRRISTFHAVLHKESCWDWERELRAVMHVRSAESSAGEIPYYGRTAEVDLDELIESVYVSPTAPDWFGELLQAVMRRYGHSQPVVPSDLLREPETLVLD